MANTATVSKATIAMRGRALRKAMAALRMLSGLWAMSGGEAGSEATPASDCELLVEAEPESDCESLVEAEPESDCELLVEAEPESECASPAEPARELLAVRPQAVMANSANKARQTIIRVRVVPKCQVFISTAPLNHRVYSIRLS